MDALNTYLPPKGIEQPSVISGQKRAEIRAAAEEFEAVFLTEMMRPIFDMQEPDSFFGGGKAEKTYRSMMVDEYGKQISKAGGIGLADAVEREMIKLQEVHSQK